MVRNISHALGSCSLDKHNHHTRQCQIVSLEIKKKSGVNHNIPLYISFAILSLLEIHAFYFRSSITSFRDLDFSRYPCLRPTQVKKLGLHPD